jgi:hypothetical protein
MIILIIMIMIIIMIIVIVILLLLLLLIIIIIIIIIILLLLLFLLFFSVFFFCFLAPLASLPRSLFVAWPHAHTHTTRCYPQALLRRLKDSKRLMLFLDLHGR